MASSEIRSPSVIAASVNEWPPPIAFTRWPASAARRTIAATSSVRRLVHRRGHASLVAGPVPRADSHRGSVGQRSGTSAVRRRSRDDGQAPARTSTVSIELVDGGRVVHREAQHRREVATLHVVARRTGDRSATSGCGAPSAARRVPRRSARQAGRLSTVTMPHCWTPWSCTTESGVGEQRPQLVLHARRPSPRSDRCPSPGRARPPRRGRATRRGCTPSTRTAGVGGEFVAVARHEVGAVMIGLGRDARGRGSTRGRRGSRCRAARAGTCVPWPTGSRNRSPRRRGRAVRPTGTRRAGTARRPIGSARRSRRPGFTSPPLVGTWVSDTSATSPRLSASAIAVDRHLPGFVARHPLDDHPVLSAARRKATALAPYS